MKTLVALLTVLLAYKTYRVIQFDAAVFKDGIYDKVPNHQLPQITLNASNQVDVLGKSVQVITEPQNLGQSSAKKSDFCLVILSAPGNFENRLLTRTFLKNTDLKATFHWVFVLGRTNSSETQVFSLHNFTFSKKSTSSRLKFKQGAESVSAFSNHCCSVLISVNQPEL